MSTPIILRLFITTWMAMFLSSCATVHESYSPDGRIAYSLNCSGTARGWDKCYSAAGNLCKGLGYDVLSRSSEDVAFSSIGGSFSNQVGSFGGSSVKTNERAMLIACKSGSSSNTHTENSGSSQIIAKAPTNLTFLPPTGWEPKPLSDRMRQNGVFASALNRTIDCGTAISAIPKSSISDIITFASTRRANQAARLTNPIPSEIVELKINGRHAVRFEVTGSIPSSKGQFTYQQTIIEGTHEIAVTETWCYTHNFQRNAEALQKLPEAISGL